MSNILTVPIKVKVELQHIFIISALEQLVFKFFFLQYTVRIVNSDFTAGINTVLAFPEFNHPCPAFIIKINRQTIKNHIEMRGGLVIKMTVAELSLPGINTGSKNVLGENIGVSEGLYQIA